jgi:RNA polymerase sigma factor (sigma-70 family)
VEAELPRLLGLARALTGNDHDAWDLTQECLIRVGVRWSRIDLDRNPSGYAKTCLIRLNLNRTRRLRREWLTPAPPADPRVETSEAGATTLDAWLERAIVALPPRQRATLVLRYLEDLSIPDIADLLVAQKQQSEASFLGACVSSANRPPTRLGREETPQMNRIDEDKLRDHLRRTANSARLPDQAVETIIGRTRSRRRHRTIATTVATAAVIASIVGGGLAIAKSFQQADSPAATVTTSQVPTTTNGPTTKPTQPTQPTQPTVSISVEELKHAGVVAEPPQRSPNITRSQALEIAAGRGDFKTAETATLYQVTTTGYGRLGNDGQIDPAYVDQLAWIVLVTGGLPFEQEPVRPLPSQQSSSPGTAADFVVVLINADTGQLMYAFSH